MSDLDRQHGARSGDSDAESAIVKRIAQSLQAPARLDDTFEERLGAAIRSSTTARQPDDPLRGARSWWTRKRTITLSPLGGLALAASLAAVAVAGTLSVPALHGSRLTTVLGSEGKGNVVHLVRFVFVDSSAHAVALVGDFNGWNPAHDDLQASAKDGVWSISIPLAPGRHEYAFVIDGTRWAADPFATAVRDDFGTVSSVIQLASDRTPDAT
jgi:hypothetical protein